MIFLFHISDFWQYLYPFPKLSARPEHSITFDLLQNAIF